MAKKKKVMKKRGVGNGTKKMMMGGGFKEKYQGMMDGGWVRKKRKNWG
ncbi:MAG: hypothetical protein CM15mV49_740 [uncultured marine virus]|nr:MAG: hypothetical protein CM15mV49_740 [uncultured marine virus]